MVKTAIIILLAFPIFGYSQGDSTKNKIPKDYIKLIETDSGKMVNMSLPMFTHYYVADRNLKKISVKADSLGVNLDSLETFNQEIDSSFIAENKELKEQRNTILTDFDDCVDLSVELELENIDLYDENEKLKRRNKKLGGGLVISVIVTIVTIFVSK